MESPSCPAAVALPIAPRAITPTSVATAVAAVPDPRRAASVISPLAAVLALAVAALVATHRSVLALAEWGATQAGVLLTTLGFPTDRRLCQSTVHRLVRQLDGDGRPWPPPSRPPRPRPRRGRGWRSPATPTGDARASRPRATQSLP